MNNVEHPAHYGGEDDPYEVIKVAEAWGFDGDAYLFNVLKYIRRDKDDELEDLKKALFYLKRKIRRIEETQAAHAEALAPDTGKPEKANSFRGARYVSVYTDSVHDPFHQASAYAYLSWTVETFAGLIATMAEKPMGSYTIAAGSRSDSAVKVSRTAAVSWLLKCYPPDTCNYYLQKV